MVRGRALQEGVFVPLDVAVDPETGKITAVARELAGDEVVDHGDGLILPGAIDIHVHLRDPGAPEKEDFASGTRAALAGGVTTLLDMPNTDPPTTSRARYEEKSRIAAEKSLTDWGLWGGTTGDEADTLELSREAPGIKVYLGASTGGVMLGDPQRLARLLDALAGAGYGGVVAFHAEAQTVLEDAGRENRDVPGLPGHEARRPAQAEQEAFSWIRAAKSAATQNGVLPFRIHIAHVSTRGLLEAALSERLSCGVTPHHLLLHHGFPLGGFGRVNPPLRSATEMAALFAEFAAGRVPLLESDHAPHTREEKQRPVSEAPSGFPGVETLVPVLLALALKPPSGGKAWITAEEVVRATAAAPASLFGLRKGRLAPGCDADLAVYHVQDIAPLVPEDRYTRCGWSPFANRPALFPRTVYRRGEAVVVDGDVVARPGSGRKIMARGVA